MAIDLSTISCCNGASSNRVPNSKKGGGSKRNGSSRKRNFSDKNSARELVLAEDRQHYARVTKRLGDGRFALLCLGDGQERMGHVRGKLWKRVWIAINDLVLVSLRGFQDQKGDILHKYTGDEERVLSQAGEIPLAAMCTREDEDYNRWLQAVRDVHGAARVGLDPMDEEAFGFGYESDV